MSAMERRQWLNRSQPQTLQIAVMLLYINGISVLFSVGLVGLGVIVVLLLAQVGGAFGIANEKKWGYMLGVAAASLATLWAVAQLMLLGLMFGLIINLLFYAAVVGLLLHPISRSYQRIWFR